MVGRPRKRDPEGYAVNKIEIAFWELLEKHDFSDLTMQTLAREAGVNRNTLYYHYANLKEVAEAAFGNALPEDMAMRFLSILLTGPEGITDNWEPMDMSGRIQRIHLFARSNSPLLRSLLKNTLLDRWFMKLGIREEELTPVDRLQLEYILNGFIGILGSREVADDPHILSSFPNSPAGKAAIETMIRLTKGGAHN